MPRADIPPGSYAAWLQKAWETIPVACPGLPLSTATAIILKVSRLTLEIQPGAIVVLRGQAPKDQTLATGLHFAGECTYALPSWTTLFFVTGEEK